jgi:hypothetical protein
MPFAQNRLLAASVLIRREGRAFVAALLKMTARAAIEPML